MGIIKKEELIYGLVYRGDHLTEIVLICHRIGGPGKAIKKGEQGELNLIFGNFGEKQLSVERKKSG